MKMYNERSRIMSNAETTAMNRVTSAEMRANAALEKAKEEVSQRLADAENRAHDIIADAQERADHMLDESEIVRRAREEARIIKKRRPRRGQRTAHQGQSGRLQGALRRGGRAFPIAQHHSPSPRRIGRGERNKSVGAGFSPSPPRIRRLR